MTLTLTLLAALALLWYCWPSPDGVIDRYYQMDQQHFVRLQAYRALERLIAAQSAPTAAVTPPSPGRGVTSVLAVEHSPDA